MVATATAISTTATRVPDMVPTPTARTPAAGAPTAGSPTTDMDTTRMPHTGMPPLGQLAGLALQRLLQLRGVFGDIGGSGLICGRAGFLRRIARGELLPTTGMT